MPEKVERKIRYLIRKFPSTEWSGVLFTTHQGTFEKGDLTVTCEDIFPMDLGTSGWTEFKMNEDVAAYMAENIELFNCELQLVHSHHSLGAFLSGQDIKMVQQEGNDTNCFVSLVVDTPGNYVAIVTRKVQTRSKVVTTSMEQSYEFFGEGRKRISKEGFSELIHFTTNEVIEYYDLEVERHVVDKHESFDDLKYLDERFDEIVSRKAVPRYKTVFGDEDILSGLFKQEDSKKPANQATGWQPDPRKIHRAAVSIVTCNLIINPDKFDFKQWITRHLSNVYKRIFNMQERSLYFTAFDEWKDFIIHFILDNFDASDIPEELLDNYDLVQSRVAAAIQNELLRYDQNPYIKDYCDALEQYIIE